MSAESVCPKCGAPVTGAASSILCAACAAEPAAVPTVRLPEGARPPSSESPASDPTRVSDVPLPARRGAAAMPRVGETFGPYRILRLLGKGGMGSVYETEEVGSGRRVALKVLDRSIDSPEAQKRFIREGRLAASVNHPNSVYIFGTEEIEGTPAISMELVAGGTLQERVARDGPMPVGSAVDAILQIVAGLEAAHRLGVLHRDIKPSNCFVDAAGAVKIGDFGLSISTLARGETHVTAQGTFLGTPAFSSPEQLRGDELDVRSDIYAVGVTLYHLLTGRTPFDADNMVKLLATVLERPAESPAKWRPGIPAGLAAAVLRCLEKQPARRFANYTDLRRALLPYASASPTAATLGLRIAAGGIDLFTLTTGMSLAVFAWFGDFESYLSAMERQQAGMSVEILLLWTSLILLYYALPEGMRGASFGKMICGLRVIGRDRSAIGVPRALLRSAVFAVLPMVPSLLYLMSGPIDLFSAKNTWRQMLIGNSYYLVLASLFVTARKRNGYAALQDLISGTRVVQATAYVARPESASSEEVGTEVKSAAKLGPYHVLETLDRSGPGELLLGYDTRLLRKVWIRRLPAGGAGMDVELVDTARPGRLRWLGRRRTPEECWDAFEAPPGTPLLSLIRRGQPWGRVRYWLLDLADELDAALKSPAAGAPALRLDHVWITSDGRAKILEFPAPGAAAAVLTTAEATRPDGPRTLDFASARTFLQRVALSALEGANPSHLEVALDGARPPSVPVALHARTIVESIGNATDLRGLALQIRSTLGRPPEISRRRRLAHAIGCILFPAFCAAFGAYGLSLQRTWTEKYPDILPLRLCLARIETLEGTEPADAAEKEAIAKEVGAMEVLIASRYRSSVENPETWSSMYARSVIPEPGRGRVEAILAARGVPKPEEEAEAEALVGTWVRRHAGAAGASFGSPEALTWTVIGAAGLTLLVLVVLPGLLAALLFRGGLLVQVLGIDFARASDGAPASRPRIFIRALIAWSPVLGLPFLLALLAPLAGKQGTLAGCGAAMALFLAGALWAILASGPSLQDRLAGTVMVAK